jgi:endonuclease-3
MFDEITRVVGKNSNVILSVLYDKPTMPVDTHVARVSKRIGLVDKKDNVRKIEEKLQN